METSEGHSARLTVEGLEAIESVADILLVSPGELTSLLTQREVFTRGEMFTIQLSPVDAANTRDATVKAIYEALFQHIVRIVNKSLIKKNSNANTQESAFTADSSAQLSSKSSSKSNSSTADSSSKRKMSLASWFNYIGVLDIFGFERFHINGFEQLLINYANEALQCTFNNQIFEKELELYSKEGIKIPDITCPNNRECVEMIAGKSKSIFFTLDAISRQPKSSDERFCEELHKLLSSKYRNSYFPTVHKKDMKFCFLVKHYAGEVKYNVNNTNSSSNSKLKGNISMPSDEDDVRDGNSWVSKNTDAIPEALDKLYISSKLKLFNNLVGSTTTVSNVGSKASGATRRSSFISRPTIASSFSRSMSELNQLLLSTTCQFIRCIKPNFEMVPKKFDKDYVLGQMRSQGITQACEVLQVGLPTRVSYEDLAPITASIKHLFDNIGNSNSAQTETIMVAALLKANDIPKELYCLGKTMIFFKQGQLATVQKLLQSSNSGSNSTIFRRIENIMAKTKENELIVEKIESTLNTIEKRFETIEKKYEQIRKDANSFEKVSRASGLKIPKDLLEKISLIANKLPEIRSEHQFVYTTCASNNVTQGLKLLEEAEQLQQVSYNLYDALNDQIQSLENVYVLGLSDEFREYLHQVDLLIDEAHAELSNCASLTQKAREELEHCEEETTMEIVASCDYLLKKIEDILSDVDDNFVETQKELDTCVSK